MSKNLISIFILFFLITYQFIHLKADNNTSLNSNNIIYNVENNIIELSKNSKINFNNTNILIDKGVIDYNNNVFEVFGNFYLYEQLTILSGENLKGITNLNSFTAENVSYIYNDDLKIDSDNIKRKDNLLYFYNNFLTPCELDGYFNCPTWSLRIDKTEYDIKKDKFTHFDTFLQIADYKLFYIPYFTHYGNKAPRKKGFLTPSIEFSVGSDNRLITPYYFPINKSTDILIKPKFSINNVFNFLEKYQLSTIIESKRSGGNVSVSIDNIKNEENDDIKNSLKIDTKQIISKDSIISASGLFTNSISTSRSINEQPLTFADIYLRLENYDLFIKNDYLKSELSSVETFEEKNFNSIPISQSVSYHNSLNFENYSMINDLDFRFIKRNDSTVKNPSEGLKINLNSEFISNYHKAISIYNKISLNYSISDYYFNNDSSLNHNSYKSRINLSSDLNFRNFGFVTPRTKLIIPFQLNNSNKNINEDSESITFNYQNQYSENRFFGNDLIDTSPRIIYGLENMLKLNKQNIKFNINQSYEFNENSTYSDKINQNSKFSDYSLETSIVMNEVLFKIDSRLDQNNLSKKEMNYSLEFTTPLNLSLNYNETQSEAFKELSNDTQSIDLNISKKLNENINLSYLSNLDVKNNYDPYKSSIKLSLFDECSQLDINYSNTRFNDNFNTKPEEIISLTFSMDYLGFFGYEQSTNLFFTEAGDMNYGF